MRFANPTSEGRVLLVDDDTSLLRAYARELEARGFKVRTAADGSEAADFLDGDPFDVVVSDVAMPGMGGVELMRLVRSQDLEVPVILMTALPSVETAAAAIEQGVYRYLTKPVALEELNRTVSGAVRLCRLARIKREALALVSKGGQGVGDRLGLEVRYERAMASLWMAFQPIVSWTSRKIIGFEALLRTEEPTLPHPGAILDAAERLGRLPELGRKVRKCAAEAFANAPEGTLLFVNLHVADLLEDDLYGDLDPLRAISDRVVLEVTERAAVDEVADLRARAASLRQQGFRIALDDLGAGYAGLNSFALLEPDIVKLDMALVRDIHLEPLKQRIVQATVALCQNASILPIVEGVETDAERDQLAALGCDVMQGFRFAPPTRGFGDVAM